MYTVNLSNPNRVMHIDAFRFYVNGPMIVFTRAVSHDSGLDENPTDVVALPVADVKSVTKRNGVVSHRIMAPGEQHVVPTMATTGDLIAPPTSPYPAPIPSTAQPFTDLSDPLGRRVDPNTIGYGDSIRLRDIGRMDSVPTTTITTLRRVHPASAPETPSPIISRGADFSTTEPNW